MMTQSIGSSSAPRNADRGQRGAGATQRCSIQPNSSRSRRRGATAAAAPCAARSSTCRCSRSRPGRGCGIHATRPDHCRAFYCLWMTQGWLGSEWKPERSKMVLTIDPDTKFLMVQVDPGNAGAWRQEPYRSHLKQFAASWLKLRRHVVVFVNKTATVVLPDRDVAIGTIEPGDRIVARERQTATGVRVEIEKVRAAA